LRGKEVTWKRDGKGAWQLRWSSRDRQRDKEGQRGNQSRRVACARGLVRGLVRACRAVQSCERKEIREQSGRRGSRVEKSRRVKRTREEKQKESREKTKKKRFYPPKTQGKGPPTEQQTDTHTDSQMNRECSEGTRSLSWPCPFKKGRRELNEPSRGGGDRQTDKTEEQNPKKPASRTMESRRETIGSSNSPATLIDSTSGQVRSAKEAP
jgi:hypothetical protein